MCHPIIHPFLLLDDGLVICRPVCSEPPATFGLPPFTEHKFTKLKIRRFWCYQNLKKHFIVSLHFEEYNNVCGDRGGTVVKVLRYKSEGLWFDPNWFHWNFSLT